MSERNTPAQPPFEKVAVDEATLYRLLVENVSDYAIFVLDPRGNVLTWNAGARRIKGYAPEDIIGQHFSAFYPKDDVDAGKPARELEVAAERGRFEDEGWRLKKDGTSFWANVVITALRDADGDLVGFAKITRDLSLRRKAEERARELAGATAARAEATRLTRELTHLNEQLQQQAIELESQTEEAQSLAEELEQANESLQQALEVAEASERHQSFIADAIAVLTASLDYQETLTALANLVVRRLADWCTVHVVGENAQLRQLVVAHVDPARVQLARELSERFPPDPEAATGAPNVARTGLPELYSEISDELLAASTRSDEHLRIARDLGLKSAIVVPLVARDRVLAVLTLVSAESGRRYDESDLAFALEIAHRAALAVDNALLHKTALEARAAAEQANEAKTQFLAVMSHELRTPLNAIAGYTELLRLGLRGPVTPEQDRDLDRIDRSQRSLLALINDILNFARLETGSVRYAVEDVNPVDLFTDLESLVLPQLTAKRLHLQISACEREILIRADAEKTRQILVNLLGNAIKFTAAGGSIEVECQTADGFVEIIVRDTGVGIPPEQLETIFEPFVQVDRHLSSSQEGAGLGLSISRDLARGMHGDLTVKSELGHGSVFILRLPRV